MKHLRKYPTLFLVALFIVLLISSCSNEESTDPLSNETVELRVSLTGISESDENTEITRGGAEAPKPQTVTVPASKGMTLEATLEPTPTTRGTTALATGVKYRVIAFKQGNVSTAGYVSYADYAVGTAEPIANILHVPAGVTYTFVCYSLNSTATLPAFNESELNVATNPATDDLLYAKFNQIITFSGQTLTFSLAHKFTQVTVIADAIAMAQDISEISVALSPNYSASLNLGTGVMTAGTASERTIPWGAITAGQTVTSSPCAAFINGSSTVVVYIPSVTIGGTTRQNLYASFSGNALQIGYKYTLRLTFKPLSLIDGGIFVGGNIWAPGNLIVSPPYGVGPYLGFLSRYSFAEKQEYYSNKAGGGGYLCWGVLLIDQGVKYFQHNYDYATNDPCRLVEPKGTWRMPTLTDTAELINSGSVWGTKNNINGMYFGTKSIPASGDEEYYLFLPACGYRLGGLSGGSVTDFLRLDNEYLVPYIGKYGYYWTSSTTYFYDYKGAFLGVDHESRGLLTFSKRDCINVKFYIGFGAATRCVKN